MVSTAVQARKTSFVQQLPYTPVPFSPVCDGNLRGLVTPIPLATAALSPTSARNRYGDFPGVERSKRLMASSEHSAVHSRRAIFFPIGLAACRWKRTYRSHSLQNKLPAIKIAAPFTASQLVRKNTNYLAKFSVLRLEVELGERCHR
jgi:hypothetical protein